MFAVRSKHARCARDCLARIESSAQAELLAGNRHLATQCARLTTLISALFAAEVRRNEQHFSLLQGQVRWLEGQFDNYLRVKNVWLTDVQRRLAEGDISLPTHWMQFHVYDVEAEVCEIIANSVDRGAIPFLELLQRLISDSDKDTLVAELIRLAKRLYQGGSFLSLQKAESLCCEAIDLSMKSDAMDLICSLKQRMNTEKILRDQFKNETLTKDAVSIATLFDTFQAKIKESSPIDTESLRLDLFQLAGEKSISKRTANLCFEIASNNVSHKIANNWFHRSLKILKTHFVGEKFTAEVLTAFGKYHLRQRKYAKAVQQLQAAEAIMLNISVEKGFLGRIYAILSAVWSKIGLIREAEKCLNSARKVITNENVTDIAEANYRLGKLFLRKKNTEKAENYLKSANGLLEIGNREERAKILVKLAEIDKTRGSFFESERNYQYSLAILTDLPSSDVRTAKVHSYIGDLYAIDPQSSHLSQQCYSKAVEILTKLASGSCSQFKLTIRLSKLLLKLGLLKEVETRVVVAFSQLEDVQQFSDSAPLYVQLGELSSACGLTQTALKCFTQAAEISQAANSHQNAATALQSLGELQLSLGLLSEAESSLGSALAYHSVSQPCSLPMAKTYLHLGMVAFQLRNAEKAADMFAHATTIVSLCEPKCQEAADLQTQIDAERTRS